MENHNYTMVSPGTPLPDFQAGSWVTLHGLKKAAHLNGKVGQIEDGVANEDGRLVVCIHSEMDFQCETKKIPMAKCVRRFWCQPQPSSLLKPENLNLVPSNEMVVVTRYACNGELQEGRDMFEEAKFPKAHPIFQQPINSKLTTHVGYPLIITKLKITKKKVLKQLDLERDWCVNQPVVFLHAEISTGFAMRVLRDDPLGLFGDASNSDYIGPVYVCQPGGRKDWTAQDAKRMHNYLTHLMSKCYGSNSFSPVKVITPHHYSTISDQCAAEVNDHDEMAQEVAVHAPIFDAAWKGSVQRFAEVLNNGAHLENFAEILNKTFRGVSLLQAALFGGSGEILASLLTHPKFDISELILEYEDDTENMRKYTHYAVRGSTSSSTTVDGSKLPFDSNTAWMMGLLFHFCQCKDIHNPDVFEVLRGELMFVPKIGEYVLYSWCKLDLSQSVDLFHEYPFPKTQVEALMRSPDYHEILEKFGNGVEVHCDLMILEKMFNIALHLNQEDILWTNCEMETECEREFRNIGWHLYFRGSKNAMKVHDYALRHCVEIVLGGNPYAAMEVISRCRIHWNFVGSWVN